MKTQSNQVRKNLNIGRRVTQSPTIPESAKQLAAMNLLTKIGAAAVAMASMNANNIRECVDAHAEWKDLDSEIFRTGTAELVRVLGDLFDRRLADWRRCMGTRSEWERAANAVEESIHAFCHLLTLQGNELSNRNARSDAFDCSTVICRNLKAAFAGARDAFSVGRMM